MTSKPAIAICATVWLLALGVSRFTESLYREVYGPNAFFVQDARWHAIPMTMIGVILLAIAYFRDGRYPKQSALTASLIWLLGILYLLIQSLPMITTIGSA